MGDDIVYPYSVLFVEDEKNIRQNYVLYLKMFFNNVYEAGDGEEGFRLYKEKRPDIMIVDINMPKLNGLELMKKVRQNDHNTKAIMLTAHTDEDFLLEAASLKLVKYLKKPIARKELHETLMLSIKELQEYEVKPFCTLKLHDGFTWIFESKKLMNFNDEVLLTPKERVFLDLLCSNVNQIMTYERISEYVWGYDKVGSIDSIKSMIKKLRKKLPQNIIKNVFATGYKLTTSKDV